MCIAYMCVIGTQMQVEARRKSIKEFQEYRDDLYPNQSAYTNVFYPSFTHKIVSLYIHAGVQELMYVHWYIARCAKI